ncbi:glycosyltransferase, group 2 family protein [Leptospira fainei serovar Hurstbridge str. BUT 6]|uniref:Glycosyltransferase, group 2 family protein n=1 Tax=Leptospira fainei serovar Hurstbridge str. BUT 6 TaxID=1193011 RepID=S3VI16_9LEPT|nr:glycosyltransferase [Leptospira fainei]EPG76100.1 glycosyltransferase, group 2 family protein [Leptospira fainei serovar Hurstbridge str. BUT 6]
MHEIQRFVAPILKGSEYLFFGTSSGVGNVSYSPENDNSTLILSAKESLSFASYFNAIFPRHLIKIYGPGKYCFECLIEGDGNISIEFCFRDGRKSTFFTKDINNSDGSLLITVELEINSESPDMIYPKLKAGSNLKFSNGNLKKTSAARRSGRLAVCICTYKREEFLFSNLKTWLEDSVVAKRLAIFISDNAGTIPSSQMPTDLESYLFSNPNYGGSGGFARAYLEAKDKGNFDYFAFCDDDAIIHPESFFRLISILDSSIEPDKLLLSGAMFDLKRPREVVEAGAKFYVEDSRINSYYAGIDLSRPENLQSYAMADTRNVKNYSGFFFTGFGTKKDETTALYPPFFIRGDDIAFGLVRSLSGSEVLSFPGMAVWHEPFYAKVNPWVEYYNYRNYGILHFALNNEGRWSLIKVYIVRFFGYLFTFQYETLKAAIDGIRDILGGPSLLSGLDMEAKHIEVMKKYAPETVGTGKPLLRRNGVMQIIFNAALLPFSLISFNLISFSFFPSRMNRSRGVAKAVFNSSGSSLLFDFDERRPEVYVRTKSVAKTFRLALSALRIIFEIVIHHRRLSSLWREEFNGFSSESFWRQKLAPFR